VAARVSTDASGTVAETAARLHALANPDDALFLQGYFKTGPGEYAEGDRFLGVRVPALRTLVRDLDGVPPEGLLGLLRSPWHEERLLALLALVRRYPRADPATQDALHRLYLAHTAHVNNWDLVDASAPTLVGAHLDRTGQWHQLDALTSSPSLWERRIAMVATFHFIRKGVYVPTLHVAGLLLLDPHDLIHKAVGWMLREVGKRDREAAEGFLRAHQRSMPRTALRYAIERFPPDLRRRYLDGTA